MTEPLWMTLTKHIEAIHSAFNKYRVSGEPTLTMEGLVHAIELECQMWKNDTLRLKFHKLLKAAATPRQNNEVLSLVHLCYCPALPANSSPERREVLAT